MISTQFEAQTPDISTQNRPPADSNPFRRLDRYIDSYETSYERMARVRNAARSKPGEAGIADRVLACPERVQSKGIRALIYASKYLEELGEAFCDLSGWIERASRNMLSSGNKNDIAQVIGSGLGRILSGYASMPGFSVHKVIGAGLLGLSAITGGLAVLGILAFGRKDKVLLDTRMLNTGGHFDTSIYQEIAGIAEQIKAKILKKFMNHLNNAGFDRQHTLHKWCRHLSPRHSIYGETDHWARRTHCNYMWKNIHQYGKLTQALMYCAYGVFQGVNKIMGSYDKYLGAELGQRIFAKKLGNLLGLKLGLCVAAGAAAGLSVPMAPLTVGLSTVAACACGLALVALVAAKLNVRHNHDWRGNVAPPSAKCGNR